VSGRTTERVFSAGERRGFALAAEKNEASNPRFEMRVVGAGGFERDAISRKAAATE